MFPSKSGLLMKTYEISSPDIWLKITSKTRWTIVLLLISKSMKQITAWLSNSPQLSKPVEFARWKKSNFSKELSMESFALETAATAIMLLFRLKPQPKLKQPHLQPSTFSRIRKPNSHNSLTSTLLRVTNAVTPYMAGQLTKEQWQEYEEDLIEGFSQFGTIVHHWFVTK